jgi:hypothetical protein
VLEDEIKKLKDEELSDLISLLANERELRNLKEIMRNFNTYEPIKPKLTLTGVYID